MSYPVRFNEQAYEEYIAAYQWYELEHPGLGNRVMNCVEKRLQQIGKHPQYYSSKQHPRYREAKVEHLPYMIVCMNFFRVNDLSI
jgi:hypothetical protein